MVLTFENSFGLERRIADVETFVEATVKIQDFLLRERNFRSNYTRMWSPTPGHTVLDFGSHTECFHLYEAEYKGCG